MKCPGFTLGYIIPAFCKRTDLIWNKWGHASMYRELDGVEKILKNYSSTSLAQIKSGETKNLTDIMLEAMHAERNKLTFLGSCIFHYDRSAKRRGKINFSRNLYSFSFGKIKKLTNGTDCCPKFATGLNIIIVVCGSKSIGVTMLSFFGLCLL